jgi:curli biogenesis system outer membrane secretion channel CsgG
MLIALAGSCSPTARVRGDSALAEPPPLPPYQGPRARVAVARFEDKTAKGYDSIGEGMAAMFVTALVNSNRYIVLERDIIDEVLAEQDLATAGRVLPGSGAATGEIEGAELLLTGAVTEFEPEKFGLGSGFIGLGSLLTTAALHEKYNTPVGAATFTESHIALDVRVVETSTSRVVASASVEATGQDWGGFVAGEVGGGKSRLPLAFGGFQRAATEKAVRKAVDISVAALTLQFPHEYFRHDGSDFSEGRIFGYSYLTLPGASGALLEEEGIRAARTSGEWKVLAADLNLPEGSHADPVDFAQRQVVLLTPGKQETAGLTAVVERAVLYEDRVEFRAFLQPSPTSGNTEGGEAVHTPAVLLNTERTSLPLAVVWLEMPAEVTPPPQ